MSGSQQNVAKGLVQDGYKQTFAVEHNKSLDKVEVRKELVCRGPIYDTARMSTSATSVALGTATGTNIHSATPADTVTFSGTSDVLSGTGTWAASFAMDAIFCPTLLATNAGHNTTFLLPTATQIIKFMKDAQIGQKWRVLLVNQLASSNIAYSIIVQLPASNSGSGVGTISATVGSVGGVISAASSNIVGNPGANLELVFEVTNVLNYGTTYESLDVYVVGNALGSSILTTGNNAVSVTGTLTAAGIAAGIVIGANASVTTATGAQIDSALNSPPLGTTFPVLYLNTNSGAATFTAGSNVTLGDASMSIATHASRVLYVQKSAATPAYIIY